MGSDGAKSGLNPYQGRNGVVVSYGDEFATLHHDGQIKFVVTKSKSESSRVPSVTRTPGRIYGVITKTGKLASIAQYDHEGKKSVQIDLLHPHSGIMPHVHDGYNHADGRPERQGEALLRRMVEQSWNTHLANQIKGG